MTNSDDAFIAHHTSFWLDAVEEIELLKQEIEKALKDFSYYPGMEWDEYGHRPPEGLPFFGAWRNSDLTAYVYLVGEQRKSRDAGGKVLLIANAHGHQRLDELAKTLDPLKLRFRKREQKQVADRIHQRGDLQFRARYPSNKVSGIYAVVTGVMVGVSQALRALPAPSTGFSWLSNIYDAASMCVHIMSLFLLLVALVYMAIFFCRHLLGIVR